MTYVKSKTRFEYTVNRMKEDLKSYADQKGASPTIIAARLEAINNMVAYYEEAENVIETFDYGMLNLQVIYSNQSELLQRLVWWAKMHGLTVLCTLWYTATELEEMWNRGVRFYDDTSMDKNTADRYFLTKSFIKIGKKPPLGRTPYEERPKPSREEVMAMFELLDYTFNNQPQQYAQ